MENSLAVINFGQEEIDLIKSSKTPNATQAEFNLFIYDAKARGLNPLKNEFYFVKRGTKASHQVGIDGFRILAQRTGEYEGQSSVKYSDNEIDILGVTIPEWAEVGVWRKGFREILTCRAYAKEYFQTAFEYKNGVKTSKEIPSGIWGKMPRVMLAKCAESIALRKAFPDTLAGLYTNDEMPEPAQVDNKVIENSTEVEVVDKKEPDLPFPADSLDITTTVSDPITGEIIVDAGDRLVRKKSGKTGKEYIAIQLPHGGFKMRDPKDSKSMIFLTQEQWNDIESQQS